MGKRIHNFNAGPAALPLPVLEQIREEFLDYKGQQNTGQNFIKYLRSSALPEALKIQDRDIRRFYFMSLKDTILLQDIMGRYNIRDATLLDDLFLFVLHNIGNLTSIPSIIRSITLPGMKRTSRKMITVTKQRVGIIRSSLLIM